MFVYLYTNKMLLWFTVALLFIGMITVTIILYMFVLSIVEKKRDKKREKEKEQEEIEKSKKLEEIRNKQKQEAKDKILVNDLEKSANKRFEKLENRVSNLEKKVKTANVNTKNSSNTAKAASKSTTESKKNPKISKSEAIQNILRGKYGEGETRKETLKKLGFTEKEITLIQKEVNRIIETDHIKVNLD